MANKADLVGGVNSPIDEQHDAADTAALQHLAATATTAARRPPLADNDVEDGAGAAAGATGERLWRVSCKTSEGVEGFMEHLEAEVRSRFQGAGDDESPLITRFERQRGGRRFLALAKILVVFARTYSVLYLWRDKRVLARSVTAVFSTLTTVFRWLIVTLPSCRTLSLTNEQSTTIINVPTIKIFLPFWVSLFTMNSQLGCVALVFINVVINVPTMKIFLSFWVSLFAMNNLLRCVVFVFHVYFIRT